MSIYLLQGALEEGLIYALVALGLYVSFKVLNIADMSTDGSFVLGSAVSAVFVVKGHPFLGLVIAIFAGAAAGLFTAILQTKFKVPSILAGIITMSGLYSINLLVQGDKPNFSFPNSETIFTKVALYVGEKYTTLLVMLVIVIVLSFKLTWFFHTQLGLSIRATGDNAQMVQASSINPTFTTIVGLCISNGLVALGGGLFAQHATQGDINIGNGVVVIGLASLVLGSAVFRSKKVSAGVASAIVGSIIYRIIYAFALKYTPNPGYLKIVSALILAAVMSYPAIKEMITEKIKRKRGGK